MDSKIIAWFSCGVTSAIACKLAIDKYGADNVHLAYIKIDSAHPDNDRFIKDCELWYKSKIHIYQSDKFKDQFDVIEKTKFINGPIGARCTLELKKNVRKKIEKEVKFHGQIFGFDFSKNEINRAVRFEQQYPSAKPIYPLIERKINKEQALWLLENNNIKRPKMYSYGFLNNNCIGCVKGGKSYWNKIRDCFPDYFNRMAELEILLQRTCIKNQYLYNLPKNAGRNEPPILPDCGTFCEIEFADIIDDKTNSILNNNTQCGTI